MANLTDSKLNVYTIHYPSDLAHKSIIIPECISYKRANSFQQQIASAVVQDLKLLKTKTSELSFPENISIKKHNYMSLCALNENLLIIGDDLGRLLLWDLVDDRELAFVHIKSGLEIKALALFSYDSSQSLEELYHMIPQNEKNEITAISLLGFWVISGHGSGALYIWDIELYKEENSGLLSAKFKKVSQMNVSSPYKISSILDLEDQIHFITSSYGKNNQIEIWDCLSDYKVCSIEKPHKDTISKLALLEKRNRFISASDDGTLRIWRVLRGPNNNLQSPQCEKTINLNEPIWSLGVLPNGRLIVALNNHNIEIYDLNTKERVRQIENKDEGDSGGLVGDFLVIEEAIEEGLENVLVMALHKERIVVYDGNLKVIGMIKQTQNEFKWGFLASHLMQILVARRLERKEGGNLVKIAVLGQKGKKVSVVELTIF